jgi:hypothetical protein
MHKKRDSKTILPCKNDNHIELFSSFCANLACGRNKLAVLTKVQLPTLQIYNFFNCTIFLPLALATLNIIYSKLICLHLIYYSGLFQVSRIWRFQLAPAVFSCNCKFWSEFIWSCIYVCRICAEFIFWCIEYVIYWFQFACFSRAPGYLK